MVASISAMLMFASLMASWKASKASSRIEPLKARTNLLCPTPIIPTLSMVPFLEWSAENPGVRGPSPKPGSKLHIGPRNFLPRRVVVPPLSRLPPQIPAQDQFFQEKAGTPLRILVSIVQGFQDVEPDVKADKIRQLERSHGVAQGKLQGLVDVFHACDSFQETIVCLESQCRIDPVDEETGHIQLACIHIWRGISGLGEDHPTGVAGFLQLSSLGDALIVSAQHHQCIHLAQQPVPVVEFPARDGAIGRLPPYQPALFVEFQACPAPGPVDHADRAAPGIMLEACGAARGRGHGRDVAPLVMLVAGDGAVAVQPLQASAAVIDEAQAAPRGTFLADQAPLVVVGQVEQGAIPIAAPQELTVLAPGPGFPPACRILAP